MKRDELRRKTCIIIRKNGEFLVGNVMGTRELRWSIYAFEAWRTRDREQARRVARITGGILVLFNPVTGKTKVMGPE